MIELIEAMLIRVLATAIPLIADEVEKRIMAHFGQTPLAPVAVPPLAAIAAPDIAPGATE
jgi:hypothetical protein